MYSAARLRQKISSLVYVTCGAGFFFFGYNFYKGNGKFYNNILMPFIQMFSPETTHRLAIFACKHQLFPSQKIDDPKILSTKFFNSQLRNPIGIAAGFDKDGEAVEGLQKIGFGFIEVGSVTPLAQPGNPQPRIFRLSEDQAIVNRCGFNSEGHGTVYERLSCLKKGGSFNGILGVNIGKNKTTTSLIDDYVKGVQQFGVIADYLAINVSSPNTPGLRQLQSKDTLEQLLCAVVKARNDLPTNKNVPIFVKIAPDLTKEELIDIANVVRKTSCRIDGLIVSNTTISRDNLNNKDLINQAGGLSGAPLKDRSTQLVALMYDLTHGEIPIIGVGGVFSGQDAFEKFEAGASLIQFYTAFIYHGPPILDKIKNELADILNEKGYSNISEVVGKDYKKYLNE